MIIVLRYYQNAGNAGVNFNNLLERFTGKDVKHITQFFSTKPEERLVSMKEFFANTKTLLRGCLIGIGVGAMPGLGAPVASFMSYDQAMKRSKHKEEFGKGRLEGIAASESANSSVVASSLIQLLYSVFQATWRRRC